MHSNFVQSDAENQLLWLLRMLRDAMRLLHKHMLLTKPEWALLNQAWQAVQRNDVDAFERAINDLDSKIHFHGHHVIGQVGAAQYRVVRSLIHCVQDVWPAFFQAH